MKEQVVLISKWIHLNREFELFKMVNSTLSFLNIYGSRILGMMRCGKWKADNTKVRGNGADTGTELISLINITATEEAEGGSACPEVM